MSPARWPLHVRGDHATLLADQACHEIEAD